MDREEAWIRFQLLLLENGAEIVDSVPRRMAMENPETWGKAEFIIHRAIQEFDQQQLQAHPVIGLSLACQIADALRVEGILCETEPWRPNE